MRRQQRTSCTLCRASETPDGSGSVRDRLVGRLTAALQQSVKRPRPLRTPVRQPLRSPGRLSNQQPEHLQATGRQEAAEHCGSAGDGATEGPEYMSMEPGRHSSDQEEHLQHIFRTCCCNRKLILILWLDVVLWLDRVLLVGPGSVCWTWFCGWTGFCLLDLVLLLGSSGLYRSASPEHEQSRGSGHEELIRMSGNWSSLIPPPGSEAPSPPNSSGHPPLFEAPSFTRAAQFRVGATALLFVFAAVSNVALLFSVWRGRGRRLASHLRPLMLSLAAADLLMTFVVMPLDAVWNVTVQWYAGDVLCKLLCFLKLFAMHASAFVLVVISLDRQHAILHPLDALSAHRRNRHMLLLAWSLSLLLATPQLFLFRVVQVQTGETQRFSQCASHGSFLQRWQETLYNMLHFITLYLTPLLGMSCCYSRILLHIHHTHLRSAAEESYLRRSGTDLIPKARMKTLKMTVVIVLSFVVCWTPYYMLGLWYWFQPAMLRVLPDFLHHFLFLFGHLNTCCDPVIYGFYTPSFRADLNACCRRRRPPPPPPKKPSRRLPGPTRGHRR
ncbi:gonadotropin-releasing hormone II receptor-like [Eleginops maclovinus]|uniref:gonadotropin-releasing hormone II receptor-like n=1 Tax=Eleginops maclovinus TaxID=56733 RepID=UPI003080B3D0